MPMQNYLDELNSIFPDTASDNQSEDAANIPFGGTLSYARELFNGSKLAGNTGGEDPAQAAVDLAREQYTDYKDDYFPYLLDALRDDVDYRQDDREIYEEHYRPLQKKMMESLNTDPEAVAAQAMQDVDSQYNIMDANRNRRLRSYGISKGETSNAKRRRQNMAAAAKAFAANRSRLAEEDRQFAGKNAMLGQNTALLRPNINQSLPVSPETIGSMYSSAGNLYNNAMLGQQRSDMNKSNDLGSLASGSANLYMRGRDYFSSKQPGTESWSGGQNAYADGGEVEADGGGDMSGEDYGLVEGPGTEVSDSIPVAIETKTGTKPGYVSNGEYVIPKKVVEMKGTKFFYDLIAKYHVPVDGESNG